MTTIVLNPPKQQFVFPLPKFYADGVTPLPASLITGIRIAAGNASGVYTKNVQDTNLTPDANGNCTYPLSGLGMDLTKPTYAVGYVDILNAESVASVEVGFQNLAPAPLPSFTVA